MEDSQPEEDSLLTQTPKPAEATCTPARRSADRTLRVSVLYTTHPGTLAALKVVAQLGANLDVVPRVIIFYDVPLTLPLEKRLVPPGFLEALICDLARESPTQFSVQVYLCRDPRRSVHRVLPQHSLIVMGGKRRWWPTVEQRMARRLEMDGHHVIFVDGG